MAEKEKYKTKNEQNFKEKPKLLIASPKTSQSKGTEFKERIVRILQKDIEGNMTLYSGLTKIRGVSWSLSNAVCKKVGIDKNKKIGLLSESEIEKIKNFLKNPDIREYLKNRQKDFDSGEDRHLTGADLELRKEFDIKKLKKIKSYRGYRHMAGLPVRGQRTKSHFRKNRSKGAGIKKKKKIEK